jgi:succinoglycan biosynthesis transport protein ExoP
MEFRRFLRVLRVRRLFIVGCVVAGTGIAAALAWTLAPTYTAHTQLFISASGGGSDASAAYQGGLFSEGRALSYIQIASSPPVLDAVIDQLHLDESRQQLREQIQASVPVNTVVLDVAVQNRSPEEAAAIAGAFASQFAKFVEELETQPSGRSPVKVSVTSPAQVPTSPTSPRKAAYLALGIVIGLALGIAGAVLLETFDRRIRTEDDASTIAGAAVLGSVAEYAGDKVRPPVVTADPSSARAEAYRRLRENLRTLVENGAASFVISSPAPNDGKTVVAANLGVAFAQAGYRVVLVDANLRRPKLAATLGVSSDRGLTNMREGLPLASVVQTWREGLPLGVIAGGSEPQDPSELLGSQRFSTMLEDLRARFDVTIIDAPALLEATDAALIARVTSGALVVARWNTTRSDDLVAAVESLHAVNARTLGVVLNRRLRRGWFRRRPRPFGYGSAPSFDHRRVAVPLKSSTDG